MSVNEIEAEVVQNFIGTAFLGREHEAKKSNMKGAVIPLPGKVNEEELVRSGVLFNLVYSAYMLWNEDYNNFSWEKVMELALKHMQKIMQLLRDEKLPSLSLCEKDIYSVELYSEVKEKYKERPVSETVCGETKNIASIYGKADSLIFKHAIEDGALKENNKDLIFKVGKYIIHYQDGTEREIIVQKNLNIGRNDIWCGRRYNACTYIFDTDIRLQKLSYFTRPEKIVQDDGKLEVLYNFEWINPEPDKNIERVSLIVFDNEEAFKICVYELKVVKMIDPLNYK
jgi:hypothetical protein